MQPKKGAAARAAARRLLKLKRRTENQRQFAERLGVQPQHITNYKSAGLSLDVLVQMAQHRTLTDAEVLYVVKGTEKDAPPLGLPPRRTLEDLKDWLLGILEGVAPKPATDDPGGDVEAGLELIQEAVTHLERAVQGRQGGQ